MLIMASIAKVMVDNVTNKRNAVTDNILEEGLAHLDGSLHVTSFRWAHEVIMFISEVKSAI